MNLPPSEDVASLPGSPDDISAPDPRPLALTMALTSFGEPITSLNVPSSRRKWDQWGSGAEGQSKCVQAWGTAVHSDTGNLSG